MIRPHRLQNSDMATRPSVRWLRVGGILLASMMLSPLVMAQRIGQTATLDKVRVVSTETHQFSLTTSTAKKIIYIPTQP